MLFRTSTVPEAYLNACLLVFFFILRLPVIFCLFFILLPFTRLLRVTTFAEVFVGGPRLPYPLPCFLIKIDFTK